MGWSSFQSAAAISTLSPPNAGCTTSSFMASRPSGRLEVRSPRLPRYEMGAVLASERRWQPHLAALVDQLDRSGDLRTPTWRAAFEQTPRHVFVPTVITISASGSTTLSGEDPAQQQLWLELVYSDTSLVTQYMAHPFPHNGRRWAAVGLHQFQHHAQPDGPDAGSPGHARRAPRIGDRHRNRLQRGSVVPPARLSQRGEHRHRRPAPGGCGTASRPPTSSGSTSAGPNPAASESSPIAPPSSSGSIPTTAGIGGRCHWSE
jgi:hypothetical protein